MPEQPLLVFPRPVTVDRRRAPGGGGELHYPTHGRQVKRLRPQFTVLRQAFGSEAMQLQTDVGGAEPEKVIVLELVGTVEGFLAAVRRIDGLEWLADFDEDNLPPDEDFFKGDQPDASGRIGGQLYLIMSNQQAANQLISLWRRWARDPEFDFGWGMRSLRHVFVQLRTLRLWGPEDRLRDTGILEEWRAWAVLDQTPAPFEIELWFREQESARSLASGRLGDVIRREGGEILSEAQIAEIRYHALAGRLPRDRIEGILAQQADSAVVLSDDVMFLRPIGQFDVDPGEGDVDSELAEEPGADLPTGPPLAAVLDGLPLENHISLANRLIVDDPENWSAEIQAQERIHGTAVSSLILHGDLSAPGTAQTRPIYVRPIIRPDPNAPITPRPERAPYTRPFVDLVHQAVARMFVAAGGIEPVAPTVEVVNFSIGDASRPFAGQMSPLARLVDWLSFQYGLLFVVSAGNRTDSLTLGVANKELDSLSPEQLEAEVLLSLLREAHLRRVLSPGESINSLSVGWTNADHSGEGPFAGPGQNPVTSTGITAVGSPIGPGFRRAIKPDLHFDGGRQLVNADPGDPAEAVRFSLVRNRQPPGQAVATPGPQPGQLNARMHSRGTSNAAALVTRQVLQTRDAFANRLNALGQPIPNRRIWAAVLKALIVHGCSWGEAATSIRTSLEIHGRDSSSVLARFLGYGHMDGDRSRAASDQRATVVGYGELPAGAAHQFEFPLPPSLSGQQVYRRLTLTLAWLTPTVSGNHRYRSAALWFTPPLDELQLDRVECDWQAVQRGTVQHEIFEGQRATAIVQGQGLEFTINCRQDAGGVTESVPYGLVASLEVAEETQLPIYQEIESALAVGVRVEPRIR